MLTLFFLLSYLAATSKSQSILARFINLSRDQRSIWWIHPAKTEIRFFGTLEGDGGITSFTTYVGHEFYWCHPGKQKEEQLNKFLIQKNKNLYWFEDDTTSDKHREKIKKQSKYLEDYYNKQKKHWLSPIERMYFPPRLRRRSAQPKHQKVTTRYSHILCDGYENNPSCISGPTTDLVLETVSEQPLTFRVREFLTVYEAESILKLCEGKFSRSMVGDGDDARQDSTRTSTNTWLPMNATSVIERIYGRIADTIGADPKFMTKEAAIDHQHGLASHMEVVRFQTGQEYAPHYDNAPGRIINLRYITFQFVLKTSDDFSGGATGFPKGNNYKGFSEPTVERSALFWYNILGDGNLDDFSLYTSERVTNGEYFSSHVIIWDPSLPPDGDPRMDHARVYALHDEL